MCQILSVFITFQSQSFGAVWWFFSSWMKRDSRLVGMWTPRILDYGQQSISIGTTLLSFTQRRLEFGAPCRGGTSSTLSLCAQSKVRSIKTLFVSSCRTFNKHCLSIYCTQHNGISLVKNLFQWKCVLLEALIWHHWIFFFGRT